MGQMPILPHGEQGQPLHKHSPPSNWAIACVAALLVRAPLVLFLLSVRTPTRSATCHTPNITASPLSYQPHALAGGVAQFCWVCEEQRCKPLMGHYRKRAKHRCAAVLRVLSHVNSHKTDSACSQISIFLWRDSRARQVTVESY